MDSIIYADVVLLINWVMNFFIFWLVSKLIKRKIKIWRIIAGSFTSATLYCIIIFLPQLREYMNFFTALSILMLGIFISFTPKTAKEYFKLVAFAHVSPFTMGGASIAVFYVTNISQYVGRFIYFSFNNFSFKILLAVTSCTYIVIKLSTSWITRVFIKKQTFYDVEIILNEKHVTLNALVDTGNSLHDPITKEPVIIAELEKLIPLLGGDLLDEIKTKDTVELIEIFEKTDIAERIRIIPFKSIGNANGMLVGFRPDAVIISTEKGEIKLQKVIVGMQKLKLCNDGMYQALLSSDMLNTP